MVSSYLLSGQARIFVIGEGSEARACAHTESEEEEATTTALSVRRRENERCLERRDALGNRRELPVADLRDRAGGQTLGAERVLHDRHLGDFSRCRDRERDDQLALQASLAFQL